MAEEEGFGFLDAEDMPPGLRQALAAAVAKKMVTHDRDRRQPQPIVEAVIATLREIADSYAAPLRFKIGDIVTPRRGSPYKNIGCPGIVIEIADTPHRTFDDSGGCSGAAYGRRLDMRVIQYDGEHFVGYWVESQDYEAFSGELPK